MVVQEPDEDDAAQFDYDGHIHSLLLENATRRNNVQRGIYFAFGF
jgi:hypothetical protein